MNLCYIEIDTETINKNKCWQPEDKKVYWYYTIDEIIKRTNNPNLKEWFNDQYQDVWIGPHYIIFKSRE